jgi:sodium/potassium-transporting ATPase subunit alpha
MILCIDLGTDMLPAISLAYEKAESDIMKRQPRKMDSDRMVNNRLIGLAYGIIGMMQAAAGFCCYFCVFSNYNLQYEDLQGTGFDWINSDNKFVAGLDYDTRMGYLRQAQTSFLISIIVVQWADVMICKTRSLSIFQQGMWNKILNIGLMEETLLGMCLVYVPFMNTAFKTASLDFIMWTYGVPFSILIFVFDEGRKLMLRAEREKAEKEADATNEKNEKAHKAGGAFIEPVLPKPGWIEKCTYY